MKYIAAALILFLLPTGAHAQGKGLDEIYSKFNHVTGAGADFTEIKKIKAFKKKQIQKGKFSSSRNGELKWEIIEPVKSTFTVKGNTAKVVYPDLDYEKTYDLKTDTSLSYVVKNIFSIISASGTDTLKENYNTTIEGSWKEGWKVILVPKSKKVRKVISKIILTITEKEFITSIEIFEGGGDHTAIQFTNIKLKTRK